MSGHAGQRQRVAAATRKVGCLLAWTLIMVQSQAQTFDPTRPPPEARASAPFGEVAAPAGPQLQSVLVSARPGGRRVAVIDGQTVRLGGKFDGAVLIKVDEQQVVLRRGSELQTLRLYPKPVTAAGPAGKTELATRPMPQPRPSSNAQ